MPRYKCNTCGGEFISPQDNGTLYFHVCPPLGPDELIAAVDADAVLVDDELKALVADAKGPQGNDPEKPTKADQARAALGRRAVNRPGHVDQNVKPGQRVQIGDPEQPPIDIISAGAGVEVVK